MAATSKAISGVNSSQVADDLKRTSTEDPAEIKVPVVRQLKRPPEIWELVQPVPPNQPTAGHPIFARFASSRSVWSLLVIAILGVGGYIGIRTVKRIGVTASPIETVRPIDSSTAAGATEQKSTQIDAAKPVDSSTAAGATEQKSIQGSNVPAPVVTSSVDSSVDQTTAVAVSEKPKRKPSHRSKSSEATTEVSNRAPVSETASSPQASEVSLPSNDPSNHPSNQRPRAATDTTDTTKSAPLDSASSSKSKNSLSPQLIESPKTRPRRSKVIQWP